MELELTTSQLLDPGKTREGASGGIEDFLQSAAYSAFQRPVNGVVQFADHLGADWKSPQLVSAPDDNNFATGAGTMAGTIADVVLLSKASSGALKDLGLSGPESTLSPMASRAVNAGITGLTMSIISPVPEGTNYWAAKAKGLGQNISSFLIMNEVSQPLQKALGEGALAKIAANTVSGVAGGLANVAVSDLIDWKAPTFDQLKMVKQWAEIGAVMGVVQVATPYVSSKVSGLFRGSGETTDSEPAEGVEKTAAVNSQTARESTATESARTAGERAENRLAVESNKSANTEAPPEDSPTESAAENNNTAQSRSAWGRIMRMAVRRALMPRGGFNNAPAAASDSAVGDKHHGHHDAASHPAQFQLPSLTITDSSK